MRKRLHNPRTAEPRRCYFIPPVICCAEHGFIPSLVTENDPKHEPMIGTAHREPWYWGRTRERAEEVCARVNLQRFGITQSVADRIVTSSMAAQNRR